MHGHLDHATDSIRILARIGNRVVGDSAPGNPVNPVILSENPFAFSFVAFVPSCEKIPPTWGGQSGARASPPAGGWRPQGEEDVFTGKFKNLKVKKFKRRHGHAKRAGTPALQTHAAHVPSLRPLSSASPTPLRLKTTSPLSIFISHKGTKGTKVFIKNNLNFPLDFPGPFWFHAGIQVNAILYSTQRTTGVCHEDSSGQSHS